MDKAPVQEGEILAGKYKIERMLAKGGMGVVVAAMHEALDQRVALKFLLPEGAADSDAVGRFLREARAAVRLRSEHVAKVLDVGTLDTGSPYIVMEYLEGRDLQAVLSERGKLPAPTAVSYVLQACEAIAEAHAHGIVHRDLKPGNLFLTRRNDGTPCIKVLDFGISKLPSGQMQAAMTNTRTVMGTPYYISPEQLRSSRNADCRSDIWALGMVLYELLTGTVAFPRDTLPELCTAIICDGVPDFSTHGVEVAPALVRVVLRCLEKSPEARFQTLAELASALAAFVVDGGASAERISRILDASARPSGSIQPPPTVPVEEPPASIPSGLGAETRREVTAEREETALSAPPAGLPRPGSGGRRALWGGLAAAAAAIAVLWALDSMRPSSPIVTSGAAPVARPTARLAAPMPVAPAAEPAAPAEIDARSAEPSASQAQPPPLRAPNGTAVARSTGVTARASEGDDFGFRK
jgi:eukaryotic-like serine/threonine-protein kinase